ncbi:DUF2075 domain-containing protein [Pedobacter steynii]|uniref:Schlafen group 3-like DNA/RNA helicase domain-containing protein n=1 Tax=Pedobacter steynii TaxID=430522 RepID=A0A1D7QLE3_9SPHI|nr:DUF2075 domain-containing protein [Pedobacter steynii]AOM79494.1 hypothetical protein BFS30_21425 [Pedobacter steynii]
MRLYSGTSTNFIALNVNNRIADLLKEEFFKQFGYKPSQSEVMSWRNSLFRLSDILERANLTDQGIMVEYKLPLSGKRIDVIICGKDQDEKKNAVIVELKQWESCSLTDYDSDYVVTWVGGGNRSLLHPSVQVGNYMYYLQDNSTVFYEGSEPIKLSACSYLHNYSISSNDVLTDQRFQNSISRFPLYASEDRLALSEFITQKVNSGDGMSILAEIEQSKMRPSKKLLKQVSTVIKQKLKGELKLFGTVKTKGDYILLDEQLIVYDTVMSIVRKGLENKQKHAIIVKGGAGTGKSVIGLQLLADLAALNFNTQYATGSKAFTETLRKILGDSSKSLLKYFMSYGEAESNEIDVLLMDEAHRIREKTGYPFKATGKTQVQDLLNAAKVSVFFIDDFQAVRKGEIGSSGFIRAQAELAGCKVYEYDLEGQFRNGGSERYSEWIDHTLHIRKTATSEWINEPDYEFHIMDSAEALEEAIRAKVELGYTARVMAGFCWPWTKKLDDNGDLIKDVEIGDYKRPWNAQEGLTGMRKGIPKSQFWAYEDGGINQVGCVYTAQGFEFDYAGIIFGKDLRYNPDTAEWEGFSECSYDSQVKSSVDFLQLVKNTYRVLLGRGMRACYVHFMDKDTERYFRSRIRKK